MFANKHSVYYYRLDFKVYITGKTLFFIFPFSSIQENFNRRRMRSHLGRKYFILANTALNDKNAREIKGIDQGFQIKALLKTYMQNPICYELTKN